MKHTCIKFYSGLKGELKPIVRLMKPQILLDAIEIADFQEQTLEIILKKNESKGKRENMLGTKSRIWGNKSGVDN